MAFPNGSEPNPSASMRGNYKDAGAPPYWQKAHFFAYNLWQRM
jgi:hypothetical protein